MKHESIHIDWEIISKSFREDLLPDEQEELKCWLVASAEHREFYERARRGGESDPMVGLDKKILSNKKRALLQAVREKARKDARRKRLKMAWYAAAAVVPLVFGVMMWMNLFQDKNVVPVVAERVQPGSGRVVLELNDGRTYFLDTIQTIETGMDGNRVKAGEKSLVYEKKESEELVYNKVMVPRAGEYTLTLSDGSKVWLNSDSEIRYPVAFGKDRRTVYLSGEAYFEVEKDAARPFYVVVNEMEVRVYGTSFNVNTHRRGVVQTTLINGKVGILVKSTGAEIVLKPSQMAEFNLEDKEVAVKEVDTYYYTAWRTGEFVFDNETIEEIMERLCIWYDTNVFYVNDEVRTKRFTGVIARFTDVADVLHLIGETATVQFNLKGNTITVSDSR